MKMSVFVKPRVIGNAVLGPGRVQVVALTEALPPARQFAAHFAVHEAVEDSDEETLLCRRFSYVVS